jgi:hypothetical protein
MICNAALPNSVVGFFFANQGFGSLQHRLQELPLRCNSIFRHALRVKL